MAKVRRAPRTTAPQAASVATSAATVGTHLRSERAWLREFVFPALLIVVMAFAAHSPEVGAGFVWDDDVNVTENLNLHDWSGLGNMWFRLGVTNMYAPVTFSLLWVEHQLWGLDPLGYHLVNMALHAVVALLLWALLRRVMERGAWLAAAIFAVHPVFVESVAWVTELRNVLSASFYLLCLLAYFRFAPLDGRSSPAGRRKWLFYALAMFLFAAALLSKPSVVALPVVILLLTWWKRARIRPIDVALLAPMFVMSAAIGFITMYVDRNFAGAIGPTWQMSALDRLLASSRAVWFYAGKLFWPHPLISIYPRWDINAGAWWQYLFPVAGAEVLFVLWRRRTTLGRGPLAAALSFVVIVAPTTGLFNFSYHAYSFVADHYLYHASAVLIALFAAGVAGARQSIKQSGLRTAIDAACAVLLLLLGGISAQHAKAFQSEKSRCLYTLERNPAAWAAMNNLGVALNAEGRHLEAVGWYQKAIAIRPNYPEARSNLGVALVALGRIPEAVQQYEEALRGWPAFPAARNNLATAIAGLGDTAGAIREYREALRAKPDYADAHNNLATLLASSGQEEEAIREHREALRIRPDIARYHRDLGVTLAKAGRFREAIEAYQDALRIEPDSAEAYYGLGMVAVAERRVADAIPSFEKALQINPAYAEVHNNLGTALASQGDLAGAIRHYQEAVRSRPDYAEAFVNLGKARMSEGNLPEAIRQIEEGVRLAPNSAEAHNLLGVCLAQAGRLDEAIDHFERALKINGAYTSARDNLERARSLRRSM